MKRNSMLITALLLVVTAVQANNKTAINDLTKEGFTNRYLYAKPIKFIERGITFIVFPNGEFDFNTHRNSYSYYGRGGTSNVSYDAPGGVINRNRRFRGVKIRHDYYGRVRSVGNTYINYTRNGKVKRIGTVYMKYNRRGLLKQIGGLHLRYNRRGRLIKSFGSIKPFYCGTGDGDFDYDDDWDDDWDDDDDNLYYKGNKNKEQQIRRRKTY